MDTAPAEEHDEMLASLRLEQEVTMMWFVVLALALLVLVGAWWIDHKRKGGYVQGGGRGADTSSFDQYGQGGSGGPGAGGGGF